VEQIKDIIPKVIKGIQIKKPDVYIKIQAFWEEINNGKASRHSAVVGLKDGKLMVCVDSPAWLFQLRLQKRKIEEQIHKEIPEVSSVYFKIGKVK